MNKHANRTSTYEYHLSGSGWTQVNYPHIATSDTYVVLVPEGDTATQQKLSDALHALSLIHI